MEVSGQLHVPAALPPGETTPVIHWLGDTGLRAGLDGKEKRKISLPHRDSNPDSLAVQSLASRY
jgi:hypothetical protein